MADTLAAKAGKSFLITRIAATSLAHRDDRVDPDDPAWRATLADGVLGVFRDDLHATLPDPVDRQRAVHLLRAVAFAYGRGLPWRQVWPLVANAIADGERTYGDSDIAWLLSSRLGAYLVTDQEDGITVYRLVSRRAPLHPARAIASSSRQRPSMTALLTPSARACARRAPHRARTRPVERSATHWLAAGAAAGLVA